MKMLASSLAAGVVTIFVVAAGCGGGSSAVNGAPDASSSDSGPLTGEDSGSGEASTGEDGGSCGDGIVEGTEECDDGANNGTNGDPCTGSCTWVCIQGDGGDQACNATANTCGGTATCLANHTCQPGTPLEAGTSCGTGDICNNGQCAPAVCGDGIVTPPEECDDGSNNGTSGDGCTKSCTWVCVSTDPTRDCTPSDPCQGQGTCNDATHVCTAGTPEANGTICSGGTLLDGGVTDAAVDGDAGPIEVCKTGTCVPGYCGDGVVEPGEQCDFGSGNGAGTGCELNCQYSCAPGTSGSCTTVDLCAGTNACTSVVVNGDTGYKCVTGTAPPNGTPCGVGDAGAGGTCQGGSCQTALCGNGVIDPGEQCDFGSGNNTTGSGCDPDCQFSCQTTPSDTCPNDNLCGTSPATCQADTGPNSTKGQKCQPATAVAQCGVCAANGICVGGACVAPSCGDGCTDPDAGVQCSPPNTATCSSTCQSIICGDGKREGSEQCDDGNTVNLDGCDSTCHFEQDQRANSVTIEYATDTFCGHNQLGKAIATAAQGTLSGDLNTSVTSGATTIEFKFMGITDLTGTSQASGLALGSISGNPVAAPSGVTYNGNSDLDWWYTTIASTIDANRNPISQTPATFAAKVLSATNGTLNLTISLAGAPATLALSGAHIQANIGAVSTPTASTGNTPGHLASENLDPTLQSFGSMSDGLLCSNISAASLATVAVPTALLSGLTACENVTYSATANHLLDVLVTGCTGPFGIAEINAEQPDQITAAAPTGSTFTLTADPTTHVVNGCKETPAVVPAPSLATCLADAAYSSYFGFASDRVIAK